MRCGILNIDKPAGISSRKVVDRVQKLVKRAKTGHAGTLDPLATGVLVVCVGAATRLMPLLHELPKSYRAQFQLGRRSDTDDLEGEIVETPDVHPVARSEIESLLPGFLGKIEQVPPTYSAVHVDGQRAYELARKGGNFELTPRSVTVHRLQVVRYEFPELELDIECSSGTYIRSVGRDLGEALGCGALMSNLVRTSVGPFRVEQAAALDDVTKDRLDAILQPATAATVHLPQRVCNSEELELVRRGRQIPIDLLNTSESKVTAGEQAQVAILAPDGTLAALAIAQPDGMLQPRTVLLNQ